MASSSAYVECNRLVAQRFFSPLQLRNPCRTRDPTPLKQWTWCEAAKQQGASSNPPPPSHTAAGALGCRCSGISRTPRILQPYLTEAENAAVDTKQVSDRCRWRGAGNGWTCISHLAPHLYIQVLALGMQVSRSGTYYLLW